MMMRQTQRAASSRAAPVAHRARPVVRVRAGSPTASQQASIQLATARLPVSDASVPEFVGHMYQWAATLTQSGANLPFVLPLQVDRLDSPAGFKISCLRSVAKGTFASAGDLVATVEGVPGEGNVLFVRFFAGPAGNVERESGPTDPTARLELLLEQLVDVPVIMQTMPRAIRKAVQLCRG